MSTLSYDSDHSFLINGENPRMLIAVTDGKPITMGAYFLTGDLTALVLRERLFCFTGYHKDSKDIILLHDAEGDEMMSTRHVFDGAHNVVAMPDDLSEEVTRKIIKGLIKDGDEVEIVRAEGTTVIGIRKIEKPKVEPKTVEYSKIIDRIGQKTLAYSRKLYDQYSNEIMELVNPYDSFHLGYYLADNWITPQAETRPTDMQTCLIIIKKGENFEVAYAYYRKVSNAFITDNGVRADILLWKPFDVKEILNNYL